RHNLVYWRMGDYAGIGPGAHGRLTIEGRRHALATLRAPESWRDQVEARGHGLDEQTALEDDDLAQEILLMGLRLAEGVNIARYEAAGGKLPADRLRWLEEDGLVARANGHLRATSEGRLLLNAIVAELAR
ncbi:MAG: coproporphyrinogen III oxidase, partial [Hyphomicrobiales bacterium]|nr:coproporphyrinogen III oxidase [Hyphomicrobiales bacterium]